MRRRRFAPHASRAAMERAVLLGSRMHPLTFSMKRVHLRAQHYLRGWFADFELTPARYDMLLAISKQAKEIEQILVRKTLGVASPTVSRMMKSLEKLGLIRRWPDPRDERRRMVALTDDGWFWVNAIRDEMHVGHIAEGVAQSMLVHQPSDPGRTRPWMVAWRKMFRRLRHRLEDTATLTYPCYLGNGRRDPAMPTFNFAGPEPAL